jgi:hypothetical protein
MQRKLKKGNSFQNTTDAIPFIICVFTDQCFGSVNISYGSGSKGSLDLNNGNATKLRDPAGSGSYQYIFVAIQKNNIVI